jgi:hypothetical protein
VAKALDILTAARASKTELREVAQLFALLNRRMAQCGTQAAAALSDDPTASSIR